MRKRGALVAALRLEPITVRAWDGNPSTAKGAFAKSDAPLAGFGIIEAADRDEAIQLVAKTPCARAKGAVEPREITVMNDATLRSASI